MTLVVVALGAMLGASLLFRTRAEARAVSAGLEGHQAWSAAMSGIARAITVVSANRYDPSAWQDNADLFGDQLVTDDGTTTWRFTVFAPARDSEAELPRFGVTDENGKINLNVARSEMLLALPGMDEQRTESLLDWRDPDDEPRPNGAEQAFYETRQPTPYRCRNGPLLTVEELLLVKGFDGTVLFGEDANRNTRLDPPEDDGDERFPPDDGDGTLNRGLIHELTTFSYELDVDSEGKPRININGGKDDLQRLADTALPEQTRHFIEMVRAEGVTFQHPVQLLDMTYTLRKDHQGYPDGAKGTVVTSGVTAENIDVVLDRLTTQAGRGNRPALRMGLLNVLTAETRTLALLGGIDENQAERIVAERANLEPDSRSTVAWLLRNGLMEPATFQAVVPLLTARASQFRIRSVGYSEPGGRFCVIEAVVDLALGSPRILYLRELTRLGMPVRPGGENQQEIASP